ncbi:hypothetical protein DL768_010172 [Monosporascus sp. mg162]|nr:hypothetical protein DL768_010172 [Monosporascus sp. mg162]
MNQAMLLIDVEQHKWPATQGKSNVEQLQEDIHDVLRAYYSLALDRFIDSVFQLAVDHFQLTRHPAPWPASPWSGPSSGTWTTSSASKADVIGFMRAIAETMFESRNKGPCVMPWTCAHVSAKR